MGKRKRENRKKCSKGGIQQSPTLTQWVTNPFGFDINSLMDSRTVTGGRQFNPTFLPVHEINEIITLKIIHIHKE